MGTVLVLLPLSNPPAQLVYTSQWLRPGPDSNHRKPHKFIFSAPNDHTLVGMNDLKCSCLVYAVQLCEQSTHLGITQSRSEHAVPHRPIVSPLLAHSSSSSRGLSPGWKPWASHPSDLKVNVNCF